MTTLACPTDAELIAFHRGDLPPGALDRVADHLEHCTACDARIREFDRETDPVLAALRNPAGSAPTYAVPGTSELTPTQRFPDSESPAPLLTAEVPGYDLFEQLGQGGMGIVHKARHRALKRLVALKRVRTGSDWDRERFRREAEAVARLQHANIVQIYEFGEHQGQPYLALELIEGGSLFHLLGGRPLPYRASAELVRTLARAVQYAHERGVIHRDLKPANILLHFNRPNAAPARGEWSERSASMLSSALLAPDTCTPKITDFGIAKRTDDGHSGQTTEGALLGTPSYMAPEQAGRRGQPAGPAIDIYALGAILYECLTGRPPFEGDTTLETLRQVVHDEPVAPSKLQPRLPRDLETVCLKCLQKEPQKRYASAGELADDLQRFLEGQPVLARPTPFWERVWKAARRRPREAVLSLAVAFNILMGLGLVTWNWWEAVQGRSAAALAYAAERASLHEAALREARLAFDHGSQLCEQGEIGHGLLWFARALELADLAGAAELDRPIRVNLAAWERQYTRAAAAVPLAGPVRTAAFSPDGRMVATVVRDGRVWVHEVRGGRKVVGPLAPGEQSLTDPAARDGARDAAVAFTVDGRRLLVGGNDAAWLWELPAAGGGDARLVQRLRLDDADRTPRVTGVAASPDGKSLLTAHEDGRARLWDADSGRLVHTLEHGQPPLRGAMFVPPDGRFIVTWAHDRGVRVWEAANGQPAGWLTPEWAEVYCLTVSADGRTALTGDDGGAQLWDVGGRRPLGPALPHTAAVEAVALSPDGSLCATGDHAGHVRVWSTATRQPVGPTRHHGDPVRALRFSPDGKQLLACGLDGRLRPWDLPPRPLVGPALTAGQPVHSLSYSQDGSWLLTGTRAGAKVWPGGQWFDGSPPAFQPRDKAVTCAALSPDGRRVVTGDADGGLQLWDRVTESAGPGWPHASAVRRVLFSPDGSMLVSLTGPSVKSPAALRSWNLRDSQPREVPWQQQPPEPSCAAFQPGGRLLAVGCGDGTLRFFDRDHGTPDGTPVKLPDAVTAVAFSPDGQSAAAGCRDGGLYRIDVAGRKPAGTSFGTRDRVEAVAFSPDGRLLLAGGLDRSARFRDVATGLPLGGPLRHGGSVLAAAFHPDGRSTVTGGADGVAVRWRVPDESAPGTPDEVRQRVEGLTGLELDPLGEVHPGHGEHERSNPASDPPPANANH